METGEKFELNVRESIRGNLFGNPNYLMSEDGTIFFTDPAGIVGSYSVTETNISLSENSILVFGNALSSDGNLYATSFSDDIQNLTLTGYSALEGILWQVNTPGAHYNNPCISKNGSIISFIKPTNGITILDGRTGETLNSILPNIQITSQALSPNGEYVAVSIPCEDTRNSFMHACINTGTSYSENSFNYNDEPIIQGSLNIIAVANDGAYILRTVTYAEEREMQYSLFNKDGQFLWKSPIYYSGGGLSIAIEWQTIILSSVAATENGYIIGYTSPDESSVTITQLKQQ